MRAIPIVVALLLLSACTTKETGAGCWSQFPTDIAARNQCKLNAYAGRFGVPPPSTVRDSVAAEAKVRGLSRELEGHALDDLQTCDSARSCNRAANDAARNGLDAEYYGGDWNSRTR